MNIKEIIRKRPEHTVMNDEEREKNHGMKWHKFLINFALYAAAAWNIFNGILHLTGLWYTVNSWFGNAIMIQDEMYFYYPPLKLADIMFYVTMFTMAAYQIIICRMLKNGSKHAPLHLNIMIGTMCTVSALYDFLFQAFVRNENFVRASLNYSSASGTFVTALIIGTVLCISNWYYYKKRRDENGFIKQ